MRQHKIIKFNFFRSFRITASKFKLPLTVKLPFYLKHLRHMLWKVWTRSTFRSETLNQQPPCIENSSSHSSYVSHIPKDATCTIWLGCSARDFEMKFLSCVSAPVESSHDDCKRLKIPKLNEETQRRESVWNMQMNTLKSRRSTTTFPFQLRARVKRRDNPHRVHVRWRKLLGQEEFV